MKKFLSILFILLGLSLVLYTPLRDLYNEYEKNKILKMYEESYSNINDNLEITDDEESNIADFYEYFSNLQAIATDENDIEENQDNIDKNIDDLQNVIGIISIDKINLKLPIKNYFSETEIKSSVGHIAGTSYPGEIGNCVIAGHRARAKGRLFNRLDEMQIGDIISITFNSKDYKYKVEEVKIVEPTDVSVLDYNENSYILTLITCHPIKQNTHRLIIKASLMP